MKKSNRLSSIELLRILCMLSIVMHHGVVHGGLLKEYTNNIIGITLFFLFKTIQIRCYPKINLIATAMFGVLLMHDNNFFRYVLWNKVAHVQDMCQSIGILPAIVIISFAIMIVCVIIDLIRQKAFANTLEKMKAYKCICDKLDNVWHGSQPNDGKTAIVGYTSEPSRGRGDN